MATLTTRTTLTALEVVRSVENVGQVVGDRLLVRQWHKRTDRSAMERWPRSANPFLNLWKAVKPSEGPRMSWAIEHHAEQRLIGRITLRDINEFDARLGIYLIDSFCGKGYGTESMLLFGRIFFGQLLFQLLRLDVAAANTPARRCYQRLGFRDVGRAWRSTPYDPALELLKLPEYQPQRAHYRQTLTGYEVRFCEMEISRAEWPVKFDQVRYASA